MGHGDVKMVFASAPTTELPMQAWSHYLYPNHSVKLFPKSSWITPSGTYCMQANSYNTIHQAHTQSANVLSQSPGAISSGLCPEGNYNFLRGNESLQTYRKRRSQAP